MHLFKLRFPLGCCLVNWKSYLPLSRPHGWAPPGFLYHGILQSRLLTGVGCHLSQEIFLTQRSHRSPTMQADPFLAVSRKPRIWLQALSKYLVYFFQCWLCKSQRNIAWEVISNLFKFLTHHFLNSRGIIYLNTFLHAHAKNLKS